jgi:hypothetical protein
VKSTIETLGQKVSEAGELLSSKSPLIKTKLAEIGRNAIAQASAAQEELEKKSAQAREITRQVIDSRQAQAISGSITAGINNLKVSVTRTITSVDSRKEPPMPFTAEDAGGESSKLENAIAKLSGRDKVGVSAEVITAAGGAAAGAAAAGTIAAAAGATTLLGSTGLASLFGGIFVTATPVGWVIGSAVIVGAAGYGLMKMARSGAQQDIARMELIKRLTDRLSSIQAQGTEQTSISELKQLVALTLASKLISDDQGRRMIELVEKGAMNPAIAISRLKSLALEAKIIEEKA